MKILIYIQCDVYVRNYIQTSLFECLKSHQVTYALSESVTLTEMLEKKGTILPRMRSSRLDKIAFSIGSTLQMYDRSKLNKTFLFKLQRRYATFLLYRKFGIPIPAEISAISPFRKRVEDKFGAFSRMSKILLYVAGKVKYLRMLRPLFIYFTVIAVVKLRLKNFIHSFLIKAMPINRDVADILIKNQPDLVIIPSGVVEPITYEFIRAIRKFGVSQSLIIIDNWDNLVSKSAFIQPPDYLAVWGKQSIEFATQLHEVSPDRIEAIGCSRFDIYWDYLRKKDKNLHLNAQNFLNDPYILFAGAAGGGDAELGALKAVHDAFKRNISLFSQNTKIMYRPHPWGPIDILLSDLKKLNLQYVVLDPQVQERDTTKTGTAFQPTLDYYPMMLDNSLFVISPLSTIVLEAAIMNKRVLALAHDDGISLYPPSRVFQYYRHFEGLENLKNIELIRDLNQLDLAMNNVMKNSNSNVSETDLEYFVVLNKTDAYKDRFLRFIQRIENDLSQRSENRLLA